MKGNELMRRNDKKITDRTEIEEILSENTICRIGLSDKNLPYIIPMNYGYHNNMIYLHSACIGKKIDIIRQNNKVCFEITDSIELIKAENACDYGTRYRSVIGFGKVYFVNDSAEKVKALQIIMEQHTGKSDWLFAEKSVSKVLMLKIVIESISGKKADI